jgi:putative transposase
LERPAPSRQPRRTCRDQARAEADAVLSDAAPVHGVNALDKRRRVTSRQTDGADRAEDKLADEIRGYEAEYVGSLWHWDCHHGSKKVLTGRGEWVTPILFGVLDDRSRLACHLQWYLAETAAIIAHGLSQAFQKRGLPRAALPAVRH